MQLMGVTEQVVDFVDIFGLDDELLAMVPQPAHAVILLYPVGAGMDERRQQQFPANYLPPGGDIWYLPQTVGNACATVALLHAFANLPNNLRTKLFNENGSILYSIILVNIIIHATQQEYWPNSSSRQRSWLQLNAPNCLRVALTFAMSIISVPIKAKRPHRTLMPMWTCISCV
jgi:hypothetical protein